MINDIIKNFLQTDALLIVGNFGDILIKRRWIILLVYIIYIIISISWIRYTRKILIPLQHKGNKELDTMWYEISLMLYQNGDNIHNKNETIPLLLHYKNKIFEEKRNPRLNIEKLHQEYIYICELTNNKVTIKKSTLEHYAKTIKKLQKTEQSLKKTLALSTLGISNLFL